MGAADQGQGHPETTARNRGDPQRPCSSLRAHGNRAETRGAGRDFFEGHAEDSPNLPPHGTVHFQHHTDGPFRRTLEARSQEASWPTLSSIRPCKAALTQSPHLAMLTAPTPPEAHLVREPPRECDVQLARFARREPVFRRP